LKKSIGKSEDSPQKTIHETKKKRLNLQEGEDRPECWGGLLKKELNGKNNGKTAPQASFNRREESKGEREGEFRPTTKTSRHRSRRTDHHTQLRSEREDWKLRRAGSEKHKSLSRAVGAKNRTKKKTL